MWPPSGSYVAVSLPFEHDEHEELGCMTRRLYNNSGASTNTTQQMVSTPWGLSLFLEVPGSIRQVYLALLNWFKFNFT